MKYKNQFTLILFFLLVSHPLVDLIYVVLRSIKREREQQQPASSNFATERPPSPPHHRATASQPAAPCLH